MKKKLITFLIKLSGGLVLLIGFLVGSFSIFTNTASAATANSPVCSTFSYNPTRLGPPGSTYLDVGATTNVQFYGTDPSGAASKVRITFTDTGGPGTSVVGLPSSYTSLPGQTTLLKNFPFTGITAGTSRDIRVDFQVLDVGDVPICWNQFNYQVTVTTLPSPDFTLDITPLTSNVVQTNKVSYSVYANCNRAYNSANTISGLTFSPGGLTNVSGAFTVKNLSCGNYTYLTITTSNTSGPASTPGSPSTQTFSVSGTSSAYSTTRSSNASLTIYGLPVVNLSVNPGAVAVGGSTALTWTTQYTDGSLNAGKPCNLYQGGALVGTRANTLSSPGETRGPLNAAGTVRFDLTCTGYGGFQGIGTAFVTVTSLSSNVFIEWSLNGVIQTDPIASVYPGLSYRIEHRQIGGANCTSSPLVRTFCTDSTQSDAPLNFSYATNWQYRVTVTAVPGTLVFTGITPPGEQPQSVNVPYSGSEVAIPNASSTKIAFTLNFTDLYACPDYNIAPYNASSYYIGISSSTAVPPAIIKNVTIGDAAQLSPEPHFSGGTYTNAGSASGGAGDYSIVNGNLLVPSTYGNGSQSVLFGSTGDWVWVDDATGNHAYGCGLRDTNFRINDYLYSVSTLSQTKTQGDTGVYSMSITSRNQFNQPVKFLLINETWSGLLGASKPTVSYCNASNVCSDIQTLTPGIGATANGYIRVGVSSTTPAGTYTFQIRARYAGTYANNDKDSAVLTLIVNAATPAPTVTITAPTNGSTVSTGTNVTVSWTSTNANVNGCNVATNVVGHGPWNSQPTAGSVTDSNVTANTTYTVTCTGPSGSGNATSAITVVSTPAPTVTISAPTVGASILYNGSTTVTWSSTNATSCGVTSSLAGHGPWNAQPTTGSVNDTNITADSTYTVTCSGAGGSGNATRAILVTSGDPTNIKTYNSSTDPIGNPTPCGQIKIAWSTVAGAQGYYLYTSPSGASIQTVVGGTTSSTFYATAASNSYYVAAYADYGSGIKVSNKVGATPPPSNPIAPVPSPCPPTITNSDLDVPTVDGVSVNTPANCNAVPDPINNPAIGRKEYLVGAVVRYKVNICNTGLSGSSGATAVSAAIKLSNLAQPTGGWNFSVSCGGCSLQSTPTPTGAGTPANPFVWDFGAATLNANSNWYITFDAITAIPSGSTQSDFYAYAYGDIKLSGVVVKSVSSNFVHFRVGLNPEIKEVNF